MPCAALPQCRLPFQPALPLFSLLPPGVLPLAVVKCPLLRETLPDALVRVRYSPGYPQACCALCVLVLESPLIQEAGELLRTGHFPTQGTVTAPRFSQGKIQSLYNGLCGPMVT